MKNFSQNLEKFLLDIYDIRMAFSIIGGFLIGNGLGELARVDGHRELGFFLIFTGAMLWILMAFSIKVHWKQLRDRLGR